MVTLLEDQAEPPAAPAHGERRLAKLVALVLAVLLVAELASRLLAHDLPEPLVWHSFEVQTKVHQMDALSKRGGVDMVFVGTSMVNTDIEPTEVVRQLGGGLTVYNAAIGSAIPRMNEAWVKDVVLPRLHPKLLVLGVTSFDFTDSGVGRTVFWDAFRASAGGRQAMHGATVVQRLDRRLARYSSFWDHRFELRNPHDLKGALEGHKPPADPEATSLEPDGRSSFLQTQQFDNRRAGANADVSSWAPGTKDPAALAALVNDARAAGAKVAIIDMPVTDEFIARHPHGPADYQAYLRLLHGLADSQAVPVLQMDQLRDHALFADEVHLNVTGALPFSSRVADWLKANHLTDGLGVPGQK
jgi:hypothetical protein